MTGVWGCLSAVKNPLAIQETQETWVQSLGWEDPLEEGMATHSRVLVWRIPMDKGSWQATVHRGAESGTTEVTLSTQECQCQLVFEL